MTGEEEEGGVGEWEEGKIQGRGERHVSHILGEETPVEDSTRRVGMAGWENLDERRVEEVREGNERRGSSEERI